MLTEEVINQLANLKSEEKKVIGPYEITLKYLTLGHIVNCQKELEVLTKGGKDKNIMSFISEVDKLTSQVVLINKKVNDDSNNPNSILELVKLNDLPMPLAIAIAAEWIELNFTQGRIMIDPLDQMLSRLIGKPVKLQELLSSLSQLLSVAGTPTETTSSTLHLTS